MAEEGAVLLSSKEYSEIGSALFEMISQYTELPDGVVFDYQSLRGVNHIGFLTVPGGKYLKEDVTGGFEAQLPFQIVYKLSATGNAQMLDAETLMDNLADYISEKPYPSLTGGRIIYKITMNSTTYRSRAEDDGSFVYVRNGTVNYEKY